MIFGYEETAAISGACVIPTGWDYFVIWIAFAGIRLAGMMVFVPKLTEK